MARECLRVAVKRNFCSEMLFSKATLYGIASCRLSRFEAARCSEAAAKRRSTLERVGLPDCSWRRRNIGLSEGAVYVSGCAVLLDLLKQRIRDVSSLRGNEKPIKNRAGRLGLNEFVDDVDRNILRRPSQGSVEAQRGIQCNVAGVHDAEYGRDCALSAQARPRRDAIRRAPHRSQREMRHPVQAVAPLFGSWMHSKHLLCKLCLAQSSPGVA